jgi:molybdenum cofactor cytidylyltransferase
LSIVENPSPERGMASSLALGLDALPADADGVLVFHADMPYLRPETVRALVRAAAQGPEIVAPRWNGTRGGSSEARSIGCGGRSLIARHPERLRVVDVEDPGCVRDIDRPDDLTPQEEAPCCATSA